MSLTSNEKLRALGIKSESSQNNPLELLFGQIEDEKTFSAFEDDVSGQSSFGEFETYLEEDIGMSTGDAENFRSYMEQKYSSFSDFQNELSGFDSYQEWRNSFSFGTTIAGDETDGERVTAGIRVHGEDGISRDGVKVGKGTVEIFGPRVEFSQTNAPIDSETDFSTANLSVSNTLPSTFELITIEAEVTNNSGYGGIQHTSKLTEDGEVIFKRTLEYGAGETKTVSFTRRYSELVAVDVKINEAGPETVIVVPDGLIL